MVVVFVSCIAATQEEDGRLDDCRSLDEGFSTSRELLTLQGVLFWA